MFKQPAGFIILCGTRDFVAAPTIRGSRAKPSPLASRTGRARRGTQASHA